MGKSQSLAWTALQPPFIPCARNGSPLPRRTQVLSERSESKDRAGTEPASVSDYITKDLQNSPSSTNAESGAVSASVVFSDSELQTVVAAWPSLPKAIKAGIVAMVKSDQHA